MSEQPVTVRAIERVEANFRPLLGLLVLFYLLLEGRYAWRLPLVADEFQGFYSVARLRGALPYVDFVPYKTVLGYYIQLPLTLFSDDPWLQLMSVKLGMVGLVGSQGPQRHEIPIV